MNNTIQYLLSHNVKPSAQRIAIMKYLLEHRAHPTVDRIYTELLPAMPTLSRTTVYNTLRVLAENNALPSMRRAFIMMVMLHPTHTSCAANVARFSTCPSPTASSQMFPEWILSKSRL